MSDLMTYILELRFYEFKILFIRIFHSDCRWICRLTTPLLILMISKYQLEIDNLNDLFLWRIKSNTCARGKNAYTIHSKITDIGEKVVSLQFYPIAFTVLQLKGHRQVLVFRNENIVAKFDMVATFLLLFCPSTQWNG